MDIFIYSEFDDSFYVGGSICPGEGMPNGVCDAVFVETSIACHKPYRTNEEPNALFKMLGKHKPLLRDSGA